MRREPLTLRDVCPQCCSLSDLWYQLHPTPTILMISMWYKLYICWIHWSFVSQYMLDTKAAAGCCCDELVEPSELNATLFRPGPCTPTPWWVPTTGTQLLVPSLAMCPNVEYWQSHRPLGLLRWVWGTIEYMPKTGLETAPTYVILTSLGIFSRILIMGRTIAAPGQVLRAI